MLLKNEFAEIGEIWFASTKVYHVIAGWPTNPENPHRPRNNLDFLCSWKTLKLQLTPEKLCSEADFPVHQYLALQCC